jgi:hypothetical protein
MRARKIINTVFAGGIVLGWACPGSAEILTKTQFKSENAQALFVQVTPITCDDGSSGTLETQVFVSGFAQVVKSTSGIPNISEAFASYFQFNTCIDGFVSAFRIIDNPDYTQTGTLSASLNVSFQLFDESTGAFLGFLDVALDFTGVGPATRTNSHSITHSGNLVFKSRSNGDFRAAALSGTIAFEGNELIDSASFAQLSDVKQGEMVVEH